MILIREINNRDSKLCYELDLKTISLWSKKQWEDEFKKKGVRIQGALISNNLIGICASQVILDEVQINYLSVVEQFRRKGLASNLMRNLIQECYLMNIRKLLLEVSEENLAAINFYSKFKFSTVGIRKNYYKNGSSALLIEKYLTNK